MKRFLLALLASTAMASGPVFAAGPGLSGPPAIPQSSLGQPLGPASLGSSGTVPAAQLPIGTAGGVVGVGSPVDTNTVLGRTNAARAADVVNVMDAPFGAKGDGTTADTVAINAAISVATVSGRDVYLPAGKYRVDLSAAYIIAKSNVTLRGAGRGKTTIIIDDTTGTPVGQGGITNFSGSTAAALTNFTVRDLAFQGMRATNTSKGSQLLYIGNASNLSVLDCAFTDSRSMGLAVTGSQDVLVRGNTVARTDADGIAVWDTPDVQILGNRIQGAKDDSISVHSNDATAAPVRSGVVIADNYISDGQGIAALGLKVFSIHNNVMERIEAYGIFATVGSGFAQGHTPLMASSITDNVITDVYQRGDSGTTRVQSYIFLGGSAKQAGSGSSAPGTPVSGTGAFTSLYGSAIGTFYSQNPDTTSASPGGYWLRVQNNTFVRSRPAVTTWDQWGYGAGVPVGANGTWDGAVTEAMLNTPCMTIYPGLKNSIVSGNMCQTTGANAILFSGTFADLDIDNLEITRNTLVDWTNAGIFWGATTLSTQRMRIENNLFDGDPSFRSTNRGSGGTWAASGYPAGIYGPYLAGAYVGGNHFRNVSEPWVLSAGVNTTVDNTAYGVASALGFSTANAGVGDMGTGPGSLRIVTEVSDPTAANYGKISAGYLPLAKGAIAGTGNTATGTDAFAGGTSNNSTGAGAGALGLGNTANGAASMVLGRHAKDFGATSKFVFSSERIAASGDSQFGVQTLHTRTTAATAQRLLADNINGSGAISNNAGMVQPSQAVRVRGWVTALDTASFDAASWTVDFLITRATGVSSTALVGSASVTKDFASSAASSWAVTAAADNTLGAYNIQVTGAAGRTIDWVFTPLSAEVQ